MYGDLGCFEFSLLIRLNAIEFFASSPFYALFINETLSIELFNKF